MAYNVKNKKEIRIFIICGKNLDVLKYKKRKFAQKK
nr:MAG TPA: hypothetical protein [Caudoviricetes sp.]